MMGSKQLSVVIATFNDEPCLYLTVMAVLQQLVKTPLEWEIIIAADGGSAVKWESLNQPWLMSHPIRCVRLGAGNRTGSPQGTRDIGIRAAKFRNVLCIESHVVLSDIASFYQSHVDLKSTLSFPIRVAEGSEMFTVYGSESKNDGDLWYKRLIYRPVSVQPYRIIQFGHSAFLIDKAFYESIGGYTNLLTGWGHEEQLLALKIWMLGGTCWMIPSIWQAHYLTPGAHGDVLFSETFQKNGHIVHYLITGEYSGFYPTLEMQRERQRICSGPFGGDFKRLWSYFQQESICGV